LESHVEPLDDNSMEVVMPDGWNYFFYRNGNTETWRGNAGWVGETNNSVFTITAPCGWKVKYDAGKIQEIDSDKNRSLSFKYNGPVATEVDEAGKPFVEVESNADTGAAEDILIGAQKIDIALAQRPQVINKSGQNLVTGFDPSLNQLQWSDGRKESFVFGTDRALNPTLMVTHVDQSQREFSWDATTRQIKTDGDWAYNLTPGDDISYNRTNHLGQTEIWFDDASKASIYERDLSGNETITSYFGAGPLYKKVRKIVTIRNGVTTTAYQASYDEQGLLIREETTNSQGRKKQIDFLNDQVNKTQYVVENGQLISVRKWKVNGKMDKIIDFNLRSVIDFVDSGECQRLPLSKDEMNQTIETYNNRSKNL
jgi:hypothetical protein